MNITGLLACSLKNTVRSLIHGRSIGRSLHVSVTLNVSVNAAMMLVILLWLKITESLQNRWQPILKRLFCFQSVEYHYHHHSIDADIECKRCLKVKRNCETFGWCPLCFWLYILHFLTGEKWLDKGDFQLVNIQEKLIPNLIVKLRCFVHGEDVKSRFY